MGKCCSGGMLVRSCCHHDLSTYPPAYLPAHPHPPVCLPSHLPICPPAYLLTRPLLSIPLLPHNSPLNFKHPMSRMMQDTCMPTSGSLSCLLSLSLATISSHVYSHPTRIALGVSRSEHDSHRLVGVLTTIAFALHFYKIST